MGRADARRATPPLGFTLVELGSQSTASMTSVTSTVSGLRSHLPRRIDLDLGGLVRVVDLFAGYQVEVGGRWRGDRGDEIACPTDNVGGMNPDDFAAGFQFGDVHGEVVAGAAARRRQVH